jgi:hypothetical protein
MRGIELDDIIGRTELVILEAKKRKILTSCIGDGGQKFY